MRQAGASPETTGRALAAFDSHGLLHTGRAVDTSYKRELALDAASLTFYGLDASADPTPLDVIRAMKPTVLVGASAQRGAFTKRMLEEMARHVAQPIVLPLSNPTSHSECTPEDALEWSSGRAIVATGSPFEDVVREERRHVIGQANNVFIFPGVGLAALVSGVSEITDGMFAVAAHTLASCVSEERLALGAIYPSPEALREVSFRIACAVVRHARDSHLGKQIADAEVEPTVREAVWEPSYIPIIAR
jgi:malic enzyme